jgi:hypothetical protein
MEVMVAVDMFFLSGYEYMASHQLVSRPTKTQPTTANSQQPTANNQGWHKQEQVFFTNRIFFRCFAFLLYLLVF